ncbi:MAG: twin-arginine translocation signal domain-containing protein, partial [Pirellulaceae bacterium]
MYSTRVLTRRDVLKGATALGAAACLPGTSVSFADGQDAETRAIATTRQLFLDNWIVERTSGLERTLHQPEKKGLIQEADGRPWERGHVNWFARDRKGLFHMRYRFIWWDAARKASAAKFPAEQFQSLNGYAVSDDGIRWRKPVLGLVEGPTGFRPAPKSKWKEGAFLEPIGFSKQNSFGYPIEMVQDVGEFGGVSDPDRRYLVKAGGLYFSPDVPDFLGDPQWREKMTPIPGGSMPRGGIIGWDAKDGVWVAVGQTAGWQGRRGRDIGRWTSKDLRSWSAQQVVLPVAADESRSLHDW